MKYYKNEEDYLFNIKGFNKKVNGNRLCLQYLIASRHIIDICVEKHGTTVRLSSEEVLDEVYLNGFLDEKEFVDDITKMVGVMAYVWFSQEEITFPLGQLVYEHINRFHRLLEDDLKTYIAELVIVVNAFSVSVGGEGLTEVGKRNLARMCEDLVRREFQA